MTSYSEEPEEVIERSAEPSLILPDLYLSSKSTSTKLEILQKHGITRIVSVLSEPYLHNDIHGIRYLTITDLIDTKEHKDQLLKFMPTVNDFFERYWRKNLKKKSLERLKALTLQDKLDLRLSTSNNTSNDFLLRKESTIKKNIKPEINRF